MRAFWMERRAALAGSARLGRILLVDYVSAINAFVDVENVLPLGVGVHPGRLPKTGSEFPARPGETFCPTPDWHDGGTPRPASA